MILTTYWRVDSVARIASFEQEPMQKSLFAATKTEFRFRMVFITLIFCAAYACYSFDPISSGARIARVLVRADPALSFDAWLRTICGIAAAIVFVGALCRVWGTAYLRAAVMSDMKLHTERLVADGPFRHVRNPLYLGNIFMSFGLGFTCNRVGFFVLFLGMTFFVLRLLLREEAELRMAQGESYLAYCAAVPRLWPALRARVPPAGNTPNWLEGFFSEVIVWGSGVSVVVFAITLSVQAFYVTLWSTLALQILSRLVQKTRERKVAATPQG
jgi:protein-S-isoprenylcysteine O-methyltransferase Ste14